MADLTEEAAALGLCADCITEEYLSACVKEDGSLGDCDSCETKARIISMEQIAGYVDTAFDVHFQLGGFHPYTYEQEGDDPEYLIGDCTLLDEKYCRIIRDIVEETNSDWDASAAGELTKFADDTYYVPVEIDGHALHWEWRTFETLILEKARFFSSDAKRTLDKIFNDIEALKTKNDEPVVTVVGPDLPITTFYRGRYFHEDTKIIEAMERPDVKIGPPPTELAMSGRMNAKGISVFYGATDPQVALAEIRPPVGSRVVMGEFKPIETMRLLNLSLLEDTVIRGSIFDPEYAYVLGRLKFLKSLVTLMTRPTNPYKDSEYLPTQVIADYLANAHPGNFDGILYPSSQSAEEGLNVVLFHQSSKVDPIIIPDGMTFMSDTYDEYDEGQYASRYYVLELTKPKPETEEGTDTHNTFEPAQPPHFRSIYEEDAAHASSLKIDPTTLKVHEIKPIKIDTHVHNVERSRTENTPIDF